MSMPDWHSLEIDAVADRLEVDPELGLAAAGAVERRARFGANLIPSGEQRSLWRIFFAQFCDLMILVLLAAALISGAVGELADTIVILIIVAMNAAIGTSQEYRAERAVDALRALAAPEARVRRDGRVMRFAAAELVPGDLVLLRAGDVVPADLRLIQAAGLQVDEAALTGESNVVVKQPEGICAAQQPLAERLNLAFKGTMVASGHGQGLVVATGFSGHGFGMGPGGFVGALVGQGIIDVSHRNDPCSQWDGLAGEPVRVAAAVPAFVVTPGNLPGQGIVGGIA